MAVGAKVIVQPVRLLSRPFAELRKLAVHTVYSEPCSTGIPCFAGK
jgi:hypothetical protein